MLTCAFQQMPELCLFQILIMQTNFAPNWLSFMKNCDDFPHPMVKYLLALGKLAKRPTLATSNMVLLLTDRQKPTQLWLTDGMEYWHAISNAVGI